MNIRTIPGWTYLLTLGDDLDVYAKGDKRKAVERETGWVTLKYSVKPPPEKRLTAIDKWLH